MQFKTNKWTFLKFARIDVYQFKRFKGMFVYDVARFPDFHWNAFHSEWFSLAMTGENVCLVSLLSISNMPIICILYEHRPIQFEQYTIIINVKHKCLQFMCVALTHSRFECQSIIIYMTCFFCYVYITLQYRFQTGRLKIQFIVCMEIIIW